MLDTDFLPKISIAMPVYNGGDYFRESLRSAMGQTYPNYEIVVVNDGSTDCGVTESIAKAEGDRIVYVAQANKGVGGALNTAVDAMTGDYFAWLSHDDLYVQNKLERQVEFLRQLGRTDACLISDYDLIDSAGDLITTVRLDHARLVERPLLPLMQGWLNGCTILVPAWALRKHGPFDERLRFTQDYDLWNRVLADLEYFHQPEVLVRYRIHPGQDTHKPGAIVEGDALWIDMLQSRSRVERAQMFGSTLRYLTEMAGFLDQTPYQRAAEFSRELRGSVLADTLISVVIPILNEMPLACRAARSALDQTHREVEVIAVVDGSTEDCSELDALAETDERLRVIRQDNAGPGAARNLGLDEARGEYVAFLDANDLFVPTKIERQMYLMQKGGWLASHTSYHVRYRERGEGLGLVRSGVRSGRLYPEIIGGCGIATPTVMLHCALVAGGFRFPEDHRISEDAVAWIELAFRHEILGIDEPLSVVEWSNTSPTLDENTSVLGLMRIRDRMRESVVHNRHGDRIEALNEALRFIARQSKSGKTLAGTLVASAF